MKQIYVYLDNGNLVNDFINTLNGLEGDFSIISNRTILNAKSILGLYLLDLSAPVLLCVNNDTEENLKKLAPFTVSKIN